MVNESVNIFVDMDGTVEAFASEVQQALGIQLRMDANRKRGYVLADQQRWLAIHEQEPSPDTREEDFPYWIEVGSYAGRYVDRLRLAQEFAQLIYDRLKARRHYRFMMMEDTRMKIQQTATIYRRAS